MKRVGLASLVLALALEAGAITPRPPPLDLPSERRPEIPVREPAEDVWILPPIPPPLPLGGVEVPLLVRVDAVTFAGNSVFSDAELSEIATPFLAQELTGEALEGLRVALTAHYVEEGYVNSGAVLPDQDFANRVLEVRIVEGRLVAIEVLGNKRLREESVRARLEPGADRPLNVKSLERRLQLLQEDPQIRTIQAELRPGARLGEAILSVRVEEERPYHLSLTAANDRSPAIGGVNAQIHLGLDNLAGRGDAFFTRATFASGLYDIQAAYTVPVSRAGTVMGVHGRYATSRIVEAPFEVLDIESDFTAGGFLLLHPLYRALGRELTVGLIGEWRRSRNTVAGFAFDFSEGSRKGESIVSVLRFFQEWIQRDRRQVLALRSTVNVGLTVLGATSNSEPIEDSDFVSWLFQAQWARRFGPWGIEVIARGDVQLAQDRLLPIEQFSVGGRYSVRGYRENYLVRDNGFATSFEVRVPVWREPSGRPILQLASFVDYGHSWNRERGGTPDPKDLVGVGLGARLWISDILYSELYWGKGVIDVPLPENETPQDHGVHFRITAELF